MSKIVILVGSMRKGGNTDLLAQSFAEGASKNNIVELVSVADYNINPCIGCNLCFARENNLCFQNDDMCCYVVIELKTGEFKPEYAGQLNYYLSAVDDIWKKTKISLLSDCCSAKVKTIWLLNTL